MHRLLIWLAGLAAALALSPSMLQAGMPSGKNHPFEIQVVDDATGRGVPLVELHTVNELRYVTDSSGRVAFDEPGLMGQKIFFHVSSHGYEYPADGFGYRGKTLDVQAAGRAELRITRRNIAERLYRVTGQGIYRDSTLLGHQAPLREPNLSGQVVGQDSVLCSSFQGRLYWFWGDTSKPSYPLGNFHAPGATSELPDQGGLKPEVGVNLSYFVDESGFARPTSKLPGDGPTWLSGLVVLQDGASERMLASYAKIKPPLETYERGFVEWNDTTKTFDRLQTFPLDSPARPDGQAFLVREPETGSEHAWVYFTQPFPLVRVNATVNSYQNIEDYEAFTCLKPGSRPGALQVERNSTGAPVYAWKKNALPTGPNEQDELRQKGLLSVNEQLLSLTDIETGKPVRGHGGSVWKLPNRAQQPGRYALIVVEAGGTSSFLGEVWYAEADSPTGPWAFARKVMTHEKYSFYNPKIHEHFSNSRHLYFEGTYTAMFSGNSQTTPRYEYNQMMYRLDRDDPRLVLPVAITHGRISGQSSSTKSNQVLNSVCFFAPDRPYPGTNPVYQKPGTAGGLSLRAQAGQVDPGRTHPTPLFYALPAELEPAPPSTRLLFEWTRNDGKNAYRIEGSNPGPGFSRSEKPFCRVWHAPGYWENAEGVPPSR